MTIVQAEAHQAAITVFHPAHPHYEVNKAFSEGSFANPDNPPVVQVIDDEGYWWDTKRRSWCVENRYRIKPRVVSRMITHPEPLQEAPRQGTEVWIVSPYSPGPEIAHWSNVDYHVKALKNGMCFATEADAQQCYDALFGEQK